METAVRTDTTANVATQQRACCTVRLEAATASGWRSAVADIPPFAAHSKSHAGSRMKPVDEPPLHPLRSRVWAARELAHVRACRCQSFDAGNIARMASDFAAAWCFRRTATEDQLQAVLR